LTDAPRRLERWRGRHRRESTWSERAYPRSTFASLKARRANGGVIEFERRWWPPARPHPTARWRRSCRASDEP